MFPQSALCEIFFALTLLTRVLKCENKLQGFGIKIDEVVVVAIVRALLIIWGDTDVRYTLPGQKYLNK